MVMIRNLLSLAVLPFLWLIVACSPAASAPTATAPAAQPSAVSPGPTSAPTGGPAKNLTVVHTGYVPVLISAPYYIAVEKGYFKDLGLDVQMDPLQGGSDAVIQLSSGNFDVAAGGAGVGFWN